MVVGSTSLKFECLKSKTLQLSWGTMADKKWGVFDRF